ncbi:MAG: exodeoxyribonuclease V subunit gamma [Myxococcota bacterium]
MFVHFSNRTEALVDALADLLSRDPPPPQRPETIVVQGRGMERFLQLQLANRFGIWAHPSFPFPGAYLEAVVDRALPMEASAPRYDPLEARWTIARVLQDSRDSPAFVPLQGYLGSSSAERLLQLSGRIADLFDRYIVYRPRMVLEWERGGGQGWQPVLFRELMARTGAQHLARRGRGFAARITEGHTLGPRERVSFFGISSLPPLYLELLSVISQAHEVHLFVPNPSQEFWGAIKGRRDVIRPHQGPATLEMHAREGHPLLASFGRLGRDFLNQLLEADIQEELHFVQPPSTPGVVQALQEDIFLLHHRAGDPRPPLPPSEARLRLHSCHGPTREAEVLRDQLTEAFEHDPSLEPRDVVVLTPDIERYAPVIEAVFGDGAIPYRVADRGAGQLLVTARALFRTLRVLEGRFTASEILDLLSLAPIRDHFRIRSSDLERITEWIDESGIRWGIDAEHRAAEGQPADASNTWRFGLERLMLGYAAGDGSELWCHTLPSEGIQGSEADVVGYLAELCETLFELHGESRRPMSLQDWREFIERLIERCLRDARSYAGELVEVRNAVHEWFDQASGHGLDERARFETPIPLPTLRTLLEEALAHRVSSRGFLSSGVTFCQLTPMRSIPFRVVCLLGMNDDEFPRRDRNLGFDEMAAAPKRGDRSLRDEDRQLFLEALLSVRDQLIVTYVGQSIHDNSERPPSPLIDELLDTIAETFEDGPALVQAITTVHPLHGFSPRYFAGETKLYSFAPAYQEGAAALRTPRQRAPFVVEPVTPRAAADELSVTELQRFFRNPTRVFAQQLGLYLGGDERRIRDREPIALDNLEQWMLGTELLRERLAKQSHEETVARIRASGRLPPGTLGDVAFQALRPLVDQLVAKAAPLLEGEPLPPLPVDLTIDGTRLRGTLRGVYPRGQTHAQYSRLARSSDLELWIRHLVLNAAAPENYPRKSALIGRAEKGPEAKRIFYRPVGDAVDILAELIRLYRVGLRYPLPLFQLSSRAYAERRLAGTPEEQALIGAERIFYPTGDAFTDFSDPYVRRVHDGRSPIDPVRPLAAPEDWLPFPEVALRVFEPLLRHRVEEDEP